jgi:hypothetical protein
MATYTSWAQLERTLKAKVREMGPVVQAAVKDHAAILYAKSKELMEKDIYATPPDQTTSSYKKVKTVALAGAGNTKYKGETWAAWANKRGPISALRAGKIKMGWDKTGNPTATLYVLHSATAKEAAANVKRGNQHFRTEGKGKAKWIQTGNLKASETWRIGKHEAFIENAANYAMYRHDLGLAAGNALAYEGSKRKTKRIAPWRKRAIAWFEPQRADHYRQRVWDVLKK